MAIISSGIYARTCATFFPTGYLLHATTLITQHCRTFKSNSNKKHFTSNSLKRNIAYTQYKSIKNAKQDKIVFILPLAVYLPRQNGFYFVALSLLLELYDQQTHQSQQHVRIIYKNKAKNKINKHTHTQNIGKKNCRRAENWTRILIKNVQQKHNNNNNSNKNK